MLRGPLLTPLLLALLSLAHAACGSGSDTTATSSTTTTGAGGATSTSGGTGGAPAVEHESEPNDGAQATEIDALALGHVVEGAVGTAGDADVFQVPVPAGTVVEATLTPLDGSTLTPHLTVFDDGRGGHTAGDDYVKIVRAASGEVRLQWLAMGQGGYYLAVRDARNVDGQSVGGNSFGYRLSVSPIDRASVTRGALSFSTAQSGTLGSPGAIDLYTFQAQAFQDAQIDLHATGDADGRLLVFAASTQDWIARNDNRSASDVDPLLDAPLSEGGALVLVVENVAEQAASLGYGMTASLQ